MDAKERVIYLHDECSHCCAQAVACTFLKEGTEEYKAVYRALEAFGLGLGDMRVCGAVAGMTALAGLSISDGNPSDHHTLRESEKASKRMLQAFEEQNGSIICRELKGVDTGKLLRTCPDCMRDAVEIARKELGLEIPE